MSTNVNLVLLTSDTDCDGTSYGAHRISVPMSMALCRDPHAVQRHAVQSDQLSSFWDNCYGVLSAQDFRRRFPGATCVEFWAPNGVYLGTDRRGYEMEGFPYTSQHMLPNWNPWVYDDTLGTALDHTNDDAYFHGNW